MAFLAGISIDPARMQQGLTGTSSFFPQSAWILQADMVSSCFETVLKRQAVSRF